MADNIRYHEVAPSNDAADFQEFNSIDFELLSPGRKLLKNSISIQFRLEVTSDGVSPVAARQISLDNKIGYHGVFESWTTSTAQAGILENTQDYPRYVGMVAAATLDENDLLNVRYQAEGRSLTQDGGRYALQQPRIRNKNATPVEHLEERECSIYPKIALNSIAGGDYSFDKNGSIRISTNLARNNNFLFGPQMAGSSYKISNVKLHYISVPDDGKTQPMLMNTVVSVKAAINSDSANLSFKVPAKSCSGVVMSFIQQSNENADGENSYALEKLPNLNSVQYMFNSSTSQGVSYVIEDQGELIKRGLSALSEAGHSQVSASKYAVNQGYLIGESFEDQIDLSSQQFAVQIKSEVPSISSKPRLCYLYFLNLIEM